VHYLWILSIAKGLDTDQIHSVLGLDTDDIEPTEGNQTRDLWKLSCWEMARDVSGSSGYWVVRFDHPLCSIFFGEIPSVCSPCIPVHSMM
jgi:hypothetical protein